MTAVPGDDGGLDDAIRCVEELLGEPLLPWQRQMLADMLRVNADGEYEVRAITLQVGRRGFGAARLRDRLAADDTWAAWADGGDP